MKLKRNTKFVEESTRRFKSRIRNLTKFEPSTQKSQKISFQWDLFEQSKYILFELKKYRGVIFHKTEDGYKIWNEIYLSFQNSHKEFNKF